ncbi:orphan sodium- and chloride-dependent neurotransmitter transporter NTT5-like, transcript variant X5 [Ictidomys tridecemlineatus]|uniref:orphan sodium- and chloride-dependent neurotransmitter transporter NTT5-like isoform X1 n=2 Tax=Ictidomys tridecemlineatus TaxID=43179 RepID=UPI00038C5ADA|nr:orphan sodium- and chloride-dependent neurotransmitter transporter NTT5-like isoform X1 [Ictidomys tridecemlineatus]XP_040135526.1 orphan sodium- and chloride-dependent neurotransmitter transporter NTT5-like isoform X1 [Ictidomys tridecemlineatus]XP_040135527.1 orphan sodium- and chloride-dependent neurotransmitter transporter NTT5-like isoform X1 [Ictidomys tridecemlineatus]XP_040135528.1 orphan sodium- and chloride-dependent neurotransmitter transporter NTT5-like isoform X1 [Ictidomys tride
MESFEELTDTTDEESTNKPYSENYQLWNLKAKEIFTTRTQSYFMKTKRTKNILTHLAFSLGLGSMWRFPYLCQQNGGGSFILMYLLMLLFFGIPLLYMEMIIGRWLRVDIIQVWKQLVPWLGGMGYTSILVCMLMSLYNSAVLSWSLYYLANSFDHPLPWDYCPLVKNISVTDFSCLQTVPHQYFWYHTTLEASGHIEEGIQNLVLKLSLGVLTTWIFLFIIIIMGLDLSVLLLFFSIILPYIFLLCIFIKCLFLEGAVASLERMITTELSALSSMELWRQAGGHVLYSLGLGMGTIITSSYEAGRDNFVKTTFLVVLGNLMTSMLTTSIIFLVLGFWATTSGHACVQKSVSRLIELISVGVLPKEAKPPDNILLMLPQDYLNWIIHLPRYLQYQVIHRSLSCSVREQKEKLMEGPGLTFAAFSQAVSLLPHASLWAILFFLALFITGLGTLIKTSENIVLSLQNSTVFVKCPGLAPVVVCLGGLLGSLVFSSHAGSYIMSLFDDHLVPLTLVAIVTFQNMALSWIYGAHRFREEMIRDLGRLLRPSFTFLWCYVTLPGLLALLTICILPLHHKETSYITWNRSMSQEVKQPYPNSALGWVTFLSVFAFLPIPAYLLCHWWFLQDPMTSGTASFQTMTMDSSKPGRWLKHPVRKSTSSSQNKVQETSRFTQSPGRNPERPSFSMTPIASVFSLWSSSLITSKQVSPMFVAVDNNVKLGETTEEKMPNNSTD